MKPEKEKVKRPEFFDLAKRALGTNFFPYELSLEPVSPVVPIPVPVVGEGMYVKIFDQNATANYESGSVKIGSDVYPFALLALDITFSEVADGLLRIKGRFKVGAETRILRLGDDKPFSGASGVLTAELWPFVPYLVLPVGSDLVLEWVFRGNGSSTAQLDGGLVVVPVFA